MENCFLTQRRREAEAQRGGEGEEFYSNAATRSWMAWRGMGSYRNGERNVARPGTAGGMREEGMRVDGGRGVGVG